MYLIDDTQGSGTINEINIDIGYERFKRKFLPINRTSGKFNITIESAQFDDCFRKFNITGCSESDSLNEKGVKSSKLNQLQ